MNFYNTHILHGIIKRSMRQGSLEPYRARIAGQATEIVLEIGCGEGINFPFYKNITKLYALELQPDLIATAKKQVTNIQFPIEYIIGNAENIPLENETIDSVTVTWSLCSMGNVHKVLQEIKRVLKKDGKVFFVEHGKSHKKPLFWLQKIFTPCSKACCGGCRLAQDLQILFEANGFTVTVFKTSYLKRKPLAVMYEGVAIKK